MKKSRWFSAYKTLSSFAIRIHSLWLIATPEEWGKDNEDSKEF